MEKDHRWGHDWVKEFKLFKNQGEGGKAQTSSVSQPQSVGKWYRDAFLSAQWSAWLLSQVVEWNV